MKVFKIAIADNDFFFRQELIFSLSAFKSFKISDCVSNGTELVNLLKHETIDLAIVYAYLPYLSGLEAVKILQKEKEPANFLVYTSTYQEDVHHSLSTAASNRYCEKNSSVISEGIKKMLEKNTNVFDKDYYSQWKSGSYTDVDRYQAFKGLRPIDIKIISLSCEGKTNKEIAADLSLSSRTIDAYSTAILEKLNLRNKLELVQFAFSNGICTINCANVKNGVCIRKTLF